MKFKENSLQSSVLIKASSELIWENITNVDITRFKHPFYLKLLDVPQPMKADVFVGKVGGERTAYFHNGKRFFQKITVWQPFEQFSFLFQPEKVFRVGYFFDLADGIFQLNKGDYFLDTQEERIKLTLATSYKLDKRFYLLMNWAIYLVLLIFQKYLLVSIKQIVEAEMIKAH